MDENLPFQKWMNTADSSRECVDSVNWKDVYLLLFLDYRKRKVRSEKLCCKTFRRVFESECEKLKRNLFSFTFELSSRFTNLLMSIWEDMRTTLFLSLSHISVPWMHRAISIVLNLTCFIYVEFNKVIGTSEGAKIFILFSPCSFSLLRLPTTAAAPFLWPRCVLSLSCVWGVRRRVRGRRDKSN